MKFLTSLGAVALLLSPLVHAEEKSLFNGKDLTGWKGLVGDPKKLYKCAADYGATFVQSCPNQCVVNTANDDTCK